MYTIKSLLKSIFEKSGKSVKIISYNLYDIDLHNNVVHYIVNFKCGNDDYTTTVDISFN